MASFSRLEDLRLQIERFSLDGLQQDVSGDFLRRTTLVRLSGAGCTGTGEDVDYEAAEQSAFQAWGPTALSLSGTFTLAGFSQHLDGLDLFPKPPRQPASRHYRRWAFESAALDLALRQAGQSLADRLGLEPQPVRFVVSTGLGRPQSTAPLSRLLARQGGLEFKLDARSSWDAELIQRIAALAPVCVVDFKGAYKGTVVDQSADPALYARVAEGFPEAWLEDPRLTPDCVRALEPHRDRITWDAPIHSVADIEALNDPPRMLNIKPSRFGTLRALLDAYDHCRRRGIRMYGGGQFELGPGRGHIQYLASLFHPGECNDVAPRVYNSHDLPAELPASPLVPGIADTGFRWTVTPPGTEGADAVLRDSE